MKVCVVIWIKIYIKICKLHLLYLLPLVTAAFSFKLIILCQTFARRTNDRGCLQLRLLLDLTINECVIPARSRER